MTINVSNEAGSPSGEVLVVAGEASGDSHAAGLVGALRVAAPNLSFFGVGGSRMAAAGVDLSHDLDALAVMGLAEVVGSFRRIRAIYEELKAEARRRQPLAAILVDYPEFNLRLAAHLRRAGVPTLGFVSPQIWAWRAGRVRTVAAVMDRMICILPFEAAFYRRHGVAAVFVGHPLADEVPPPRSTARLALGIPESARVVALLPGSRRFEVRQLLPAMIDALKRLQDAGLADRAVLPLAANLADTDQGRAWITRFASPGVTVVQDAFLPALASSDLAFVASGTSTLAAAICDTPMVLGYRLHPATHAVADLLTQVPHVGLVNLVAGRRLVPELIQDDFTAENLAREGRPLLNDGAAMARQRQGYAEVRRRLGPPGVFARAAEAVVATLSATAPRGPRTGR